MMKHARRSHFLEAAAILVMASLDLVVHISLAPEPWLWIAAMIILWSVGLGRRLDALAGVGAFMIPSEVCAQYVGISPAPVLAGAGGYLVFDQLRPSAARVGWIARGRLGTDAAAMIASVVIVAASALFVWSRLAQPDLSGTRAMFPANPSLVVLVAIGFATLNAFGEELCYRAVLQTSLERSLASPVAALLIQGVFFGAAHLHGFPSGGFGVGLATVYGIMLGTVRLRLGGLLGAWIAHVFADLTIVAIIVAS